MKLCTISYTGHIREKRTIQMGELPNQWLIYFIDTNMSYLIPKEVCSSNRHDIKRRIYQNTNYSQIYIDDITIIFLEYVTKNGFQNLPDHVMLDAN